jgi:hypothetical protein
MHTTDGKVLTGAVLTVSCRCNLERAALLSMIAYDWECQSGTKRKLITQTWKFARISKIASQRNSSGGLGSKRQIISGLRESDRRFLGYQPWQWSCI